jgi:hypothetical protein
MWHSTSWYMVLGAHMRAQRVRGCVHF